VFAATCFWGATATLARFVFRDRAVPPLTVVELRLSIATVILFAWLLIRRPASLRIERRDLSYFILLGVFGVAAVQGSYYYSISKLGVGLAILIQYLAPTLIVLFDLLRGRWVGWPMLGAVVLALGGTALLVGGVDTHSLHASRLDWAISFSSAFIFAFYILYSKRGLSRYRPETTLLYTFAIGALLWGVVTPPWQIIARHYDAQLWMMFIGLGVFSTLVPFSLFYSGLRRLPAGQASVIATAEPLVAVFAAAVFLHEGLRPAQIAGAALVILAAVLASRREPDIEQASVEHG
jgi:drug/metabolite transporter (DMT)-like permease